MTQTHLIIGLPKTGKTTFLAALWYVVETRRVAGALELVELPKNRSHLNTIRERWVKCLEQKHTTASSEREISLKLRKPSDQTMVDLVVPDLSGESFELQWSHRQWSRAYDEMASTATGALVFVHPAKVTDAPTISEEEALSAVLRDEENGEKPQPKPVAAKPEVHSGDAPDDEIPWDSSLAPPQVKVVELLQFLTVRPISRQRFRVGVIVSAWDLAKSEKLTPDEWLARHMPLLHQFLDANQEVFEARVYGLSATGGNLESESDRLLAIADPVNRIEIIGPGVSPHDITAPIQYLMT